MGYSVPVNSVVLFNVEHVLIHDFIVAEPTRVGLALADRVWTLELTGA